MGEKAAVLGETWPSSGLETPGPETSGPVTPGPVTSSTSAPPAALEPVRTADGSWTLRAAGHGQTYRSVFGASSESLAVFVEGAGVAARLAEGRPTTVLEVGLGPATNLWHSAALALAHGTPLRYLAVERAPLPAAALVAVRPEAWAPRPLVDAFLAARRDWGDPPMGSSLGFSFGPLNLELWVGDVADLAALDVLLKRWGPVDAVYQDPFSPEVDPTAWSAEVLGRLAAALRPSGCLVSYSVQGQVRRALAAAGLDVRKVAGPAGGKREVLRASRPAQPTDPDPA